MNLNNHPNKRIEWVVNEFYGGKYSRLAKKLNVAPATISQILHGGAYPSWKVFVGILELHPEISPDWFLHDRGAKLRYPDSNDHRAVMEQNQRFRQRIEELYEVVKNT